MREILEEKRIRKLLDEGWRFSIKKTGKYAYIRRRRAGSRDVNERRYSEEVWETIRRMQEPGAGFRVDHREVYQLRRDFHYQLSLSRARDRPKTCVHVVDGFCTYWRWDPNVDVFLFTLAELDKYPKMPWGAITESTRPAGDGKVIVEAGLDYCKDCTEYRRDETMVAEAHAGSGAPRQT